MSVFCNFKRGDLSFALLHNVKGEPNPIECKIHWGYNKSARGIKNSLVCGHSTALGGSHCDLCMVQAKYFSGWSIQPASSLYQLIYLPSSNAIKIMPFTPTLYTQIAVKLESEDKDLYGTLIHLKKRYPGYNGHRKTKSWHRKEQYEITTGGKIANYSVIQSQAYEILPNLNTIKPDLLKRASMGLLSG